MLLLFCGSMCAKQRHSELVPPVMHQKIKCHIRFIEHLGQLFYCIIVHGSNHLILFLNHLGYHHHHHHHDIDHFILGRLSPAWATSSSRSRRVRHSSKDCCHDATRDISLSSQEWQQKDVKEKVYMAPWSRAWRKFHIICIFHWFGFFFFLQQTKDEEEIVTSLYN